MQPSQDLYLSSEERFSIWQVKVAERPELLSVYATSSATTSEEDEKKLPETNKEEEDGAGGGSNDDDYPPPLTDGCDIPRWREHNIIDMKGCSIAKACLQVGSGCPLIRRESQLPLMKVESMATTSGTHQKWKQLKQKLVQDYPISPDGSSNVCRRISASSGVAHTMNPWFERDNVPVLLEDLANEWPAYQHSMKWDNLLQTYGDTEWRVSDTHGETLTLRTYTKYIYSLEGLTDDAPLALYDSQFHLDERAALVQDYTVPKCFAQDLYSVLDEEEEEVEGDVDKGGDVGKNERDSGADDVSGNNSTADSVEVSRPPYRWILIGGERSGTGLHVDPVGTHAWVTLIEGCKRWVLFPPHVDRRMIGMQTPQIPSAIWFQTHFEQAMKHYGNDAIHVVQRPGETVYVPCGWPHLVLNLEPSIALTENYATCYPSMELFWQAVQAEEPHLAQALREKLQQ